MKEKLFRIMPCSYEEKEVYDIYMKGCGGVTGREPIGHIEKKDEEELIKIRISYITLGIDEVIDLLNEVKRQFGGGFVLDMC